MPSYDSADSGKGCRAWYPRGAPRAVPASSDRLRLEIHQGTRTSSHRAPRRTCDSWVVVAGIVYCSLLPHLQICCHRAATPQSTRTAPYQTASRCLFPLHPSLGSEGGGGGHGATEPTARGALCCKLRSCGGGGMAPGRRWRWGQRQSGQGVGLFGYCSEWFVSLLVVAIAAGVVISLLHSETNSLTT